MREILRPLPLRPCAGAPEVVSGLTVLRGVPAPVVDLGALLGVREGAPPRRYVSLKLGPRVAALAVDEVIDVRTLDPATLLDLPPLLAGAAAGAVRVLGTLDGELLAVLEAARLVPEDAWAALERAEGPR